MCKTFSTYRPLLNDYEKNDPSIPKECLLERTYKIPSEKDYQKLLLG